jgi:hypothetical protein
LVESPFDFLDHPVRPLCEQVFVGEGQADPSRNEKDGVELSVSIPRVPHRSSFRDKPCAIFSTSRGVDPNGTKLVLTRIESSLIQVVVSKQLGQEDSTMFKDEHRRKVWDELRQRDLRCFGELFSVRVIGAAAARAGVPVGRGPLYLVNLVWLGIASAWHGTRSFSEVLALTLNLLRDAEGFAQTPFGQEQRRAKRRKQRKSKHSPHRHDATQVTEEAFVQARRRMPWPFWLALIALLAEEFQAAHPEQVSWRGFRLLAIDGTCIGLPNWKRLKEYFGLAKGGRGSGRVQARMVMLQCPLVRMPFAIQVGSLKEGEITLAERLLPQILRGDLVLLDRGFWSYRLMAQILQRQAFFGIRRKTGIALQALRKLGPHDRLVRWRPHPTSVRRWQRQGHLALPEWLDLRVIDYQIPGFRPSAVVTNATDPQRLSREDWVRLTTREPGRNLQPGLYHRRWEIETTFRELKISQKMKGSIRSRTPEGVRFELGGHVVLYLLVRWLIVEAAEKSGDDPLRLSFVKAFRELDDMRYALLTSTPDHIARILLPRLLARIAHNIVPLRAGRHYSRPHDTKPKHKGGNRYQMPAKLPAKA